MGEVESVVEKKKKKKKKKTKIKGCMNLFTYQSLLTTKEN